jgi:lysophospholipase L1-like esterase
MGQGVTHIMSRLIFMRATTMALAVAALGSLTLGPARAQTAAATAVAASTPVLAPAPARTPACNVSAEKARFDLPLKRVARRLAAGKPVKIVALGSSSTYGAGASTPDGSYPSRLAEELAMRLPGHKIAVINRGVNGDEARDMLARLDSDVISEQPDLVLWQLGTNSLLRDRAVLPHASLLHKGLARLKATDADIVLIDPQYAPKVLAKANAAGMVSLIAKAAKAESVCLFQRFALMQQWHEGERMPFEAFVSSDGLHMNDWSYACVAKWLGAAIAEAATRPTATAAAPQVAR